MEGSYLNDLEGLPGRGFQDVSRAEEGEGETPITAM